MKKIHISFAVSVILVMLGCGGHHEAHHHEKHSFAITSPLKKDTVLVSKYVAQIRAIQHIEIRAYESGYLQEIYVDEGQFVKKGEKMFQITPLLYEAEMEKALAEVKFAEIEYLNTKSLADSNVVSANELALAKAKYDKAKAELSLQKTHLGFTLIRAPFSGMMDRFNVRLGSLLEEGELMTSLSDNSEMWVYFNVPEAEYLDYQSSIHEDSVMRVQLMMANNELFTYSGVVETVVGDFNNETGNIAYRATVPNPHGLLRHGETGNVLIEVPKKDALLIPQKATFEILDHKYVFIVDEHNVIRQKRILVDAELPHLYAVQSGLEESDRILLNGLRKVRNNDTISVDFQQPDSVLSHLNVYAE